MENEILYSIFIKLVIKMKSVILSSSDMVVIAAINIFKSLIISDINSSLFVKKKNTNIDYINSFFKLIIFLKNIKKKINS